MCFLMTILVFSAAFGNRRTLPTSTRSLGNVCKSERLILPKPNDTPRAAANIFQEQVAYCKFDNNAHRRLNNGVQFLVARCQISCISVTSSCGRAVRMSNSSQVFDKLWPITDATLGGLSRAQF
ncbi:hypothetical protein Tcan_00841, partial [Toxocara canis]